MSYAWARNANTYVVVPVYNEAAVVGGVIRRVSKDFQNIICVDDGSTDESSKKIQKSGAVLVRHPVNLGAGAATQTGIDYALLDPKAAYFITIDADGQHDIKDAVNMLDYLKKNDLDIVLGSRFLGAIENISAFKRMFLKLAAVFSDRTTGVKLTDPHVGLRVFNRKFAENLKITLPDFAHASELIHRIAEGNYKYAEVPVKVTYSDYSKAKGQPMLNAVNIIFDLMFHRITKK
jgi:glycosyltransferase involved in cell wall biosynthesis